MICMQCCTHKYVLGGYENKCQKHVLLLNLSQMYSTHSCTKLFACKLYKHSRVLEESIVQYICHFNTSS